MLESRDRLVQDTDRETKNEIAEARTRLVGLKIKGFGKNEKTREESC